jgi:hypothetical protein
MVFIIQNRLIYNQFKDHWWVSAGSDLTSQAPFAQFPPAQASPNSPIAAGPGTKGNSNPFAFQGALYNYPATY